MCLLHTCGSIVKHLSSGFIFIKIKSIFSSSLSSKLVQFSEHTTGLISDRLFETCITPRKKHDFFSREQPRMVATPRSP